jgi:hypothetical protein
MIKDKEKGKMKVREGKMKYMDEDNEKKVNKSGKYKGKEETEEKREGKQKNFAVIYIYIYIYIYVPGNPLLFTNHHSQPSLWPGSDPADACVWSRQCLHGH